MQAEDALHQIVNVTKTACLGARSENGQVFSTQRLSNEGRQDTSIIQAHPWSVRVENPHNPCFHTVVTMVGHGHGFLESLGFVIDASRSDGVHVAEVLLMLRVHLWIAIDFTGRSDGDPGSFVLGQTQAIVDSQRSNFQGLDWNPEVVNGRRGRREMQNVIERAFQFNVLRDIVVVEGKVLVIHQMVDVFEISCDEVVHGIHLKSFSDEAVAKM